MGVNSLWELLAPAGDVGDTLCTLAEKGFRRPSIRSYRVGVDASAWLYHADIYSYQGMDTEEIGASVSLLSSDSRPFPQNTHPLPFQRTRATNAALPTATLHATRHLTRRRL